MRKRTVLLARIARLEQRHFRQPLKRRIVIAIDTMADADCVGMTDGHNLHVMRLGGEPVEAFTRRAAEVIGSRAIFYVYGPGAASEREGEAQWQTGPAIA